MELKKVKNQKSRNRRLWDR